MVRRNPWWGALRLVVYVDTIRAWWGDLAVAHPQGGFAVGAGHCELSDAEVILYESGEVVAVGGGVGGA